MEPSISSVGLPVTATADVAGRAGLRSLTGLLGDRLGGFDQLGQRGDALVGGLQRLLRLADRVEQRVQVAGAIAEDCEVKKLPGLSSAELTFLPVARRFCVALISSAVLCSESRFCRTQTTG